MLSPADITRIKHRIAVILRAYAGVASTTTASMLPLRGLQGKLYEAHVLATICEKLVTEEGCNINLTVGFHLMLKQKGGPINRTYPYFEVWRGGRLRFELFTDIYFTSLSHHMKASLISKSHGDYHELDIALVTAGASGNPEHSEVVLAIECKNTSIQKSIIREVLGFRRELSFCSQIPKRTLFSKWPTDFIHSIPNSVHMLYCSDPRVNDYAANCLKFGIIVNHHNM